MLSQTYMLVAIIVQVDGHCVHLQAIATLGHASGYQSIALLMSDYTGCAFSRAQFG